MKTKKTASAAKQKKTPKMNIRKPETIRTDKTYPINEIIKQCICDNHDGKMAGMLSISTSIVWNASCTAKRKINTLVCSKCYSAALNDQRKGLDIKTKVNHLILNYRRYKVSEMPTLNALMFRFEAFADLSSDIQAWNYLALVLHNPLVNFGLWTKNPWHLYNAIMKYNNGKKPKNLQVLYSSPVINQCCANALKMYILPGSVPMIDKVFTVYTAEFAIEHGIKIQCGNSVCIECKTCYFKNRVKLVNEVIKTEQKKYYKLLAAKQKSGKK